MRNFTLLVFMTLLFTIVGLLLLKPSRWERAAFQMELIKVKNTSPAFTSGRKPPGLFHGPARRIQYIIATLTWKVPASVRRVLFAVTLHKE